MIGMQDILSSPKSPWHSGFFFLTGSGIGLSLCKSKSKSEIKSCENPYLQDIWEVTRSEILWDLRIEISFSEGLTDRRTSVILMSLLQLINLECSRYKVRLQKTAYFMTLAYPTLIEETKKLWQFGRHLWTPPAFDFLSSLMNKNLWVKYLVVVIMKIIT